MSIIQHEHDLPAGLDLGPVVAVDSEAMGLKPHRDRLCLVQLSAGDGDAHLVRIDQATRPAHLIALLTDPAVLKIFHFARFDLGLLRHALGVRCQPIYCTKIASRLARTYTDKHGLADLCQELLGIELDKEMQSSDWGSPELTRAQQDYAASDVLHLHRLRARLDAMLAREGRLELATTCFEFLPHRADLDLAGWAEIDVFAH